MAESKTAASVLVEQKTIISEYLGREITVDVYLPV
jgi:hypothetical protein